MVAVLGANSVTGGFEVENSVRLFSNTSMTMTPSGAPTNADINTLSFWCKLSSISGERSPIFAAGNAAGVHFRDDDRIDFYHAGGSMRTNRVFRDTSAWYHIVFRTDTTDGTANDRLRVYINGVQETSFASRSNPDQNANAGFGSAAEHIIGCNNDPANYFNGYIAEMCFIDGLSLGPDSFGEFDSDSGIWRPIDVSGLTFGKNGFYLEFKSGGNLGDEDKGTQTADWSETNLTVLDQSTDTCTNNFCTFTSTDPTAGAWTLSEGNLKCQRTTGTSILFGTSIMPTTGKWYFEVNIGEAGQSDRSRVGVMNYQSVLDNSNYTGVINTPSAVFKGVTTSCKAAKHFEGTGSGVTEYTDSGAFADDDIVQFALDLDNKAIYIGRNGTFLTQDGNSGGDPTSGGSKTGAISTNTTIFDGSPMTVCTGLSVGSGTDTSTMLFNFGSPPYAISSSNADADDHGNFEYAVPSGYFALCSKNLAEYG